MNGVSWTNTQFVTCLQATLFMSPSTYCGWRHCFLAVCTWICVSVHTFQTLLTLSWKVNDIFTKLSALFNLREGWTLQILVQRSKFKVSGSKCFKMHFLSLLMRCLDNYRTEFTKLSALMHFGTRMKGLFLGSKGQRPRSQHDEGPSGQR